MKKWLVDTRAEIWRRYIVEAPTQEEAEELVFDTGAVLIETDEGEAECAGSTAYFQYEKD